MIFVVFAVAYFIGELQGERTAIAREFELQRREPDAEFRAWERQLA